MNEMAAVARDNITVEEARSGQEWDRFVDSQPNATMYHRWGWKQVLERGLGLPTHFLVARSSASITGILPLAHQKSRLFGNFFTSLPALNGGGIFALDQESETALFRTAVRIAEAHRARSIELRHRSEHALGIPRKQHKITLVKQVNADTDKMFAQLDKKLRADVRKPIKVGLTSEFGRREFLDCFYPIFAQNMRDLGTPVYPKRFFSELLDAFPKDVFITVVRHQGLAVASSFLISYRDTIEAAWSSSTRQHLSLKPNMLLYWENLCLAAGQGFRYFDFGRSSIGSGTHRFKLQWGVEERQLFWDYWLPQGVAMPQLSPDNPKYRLVIWAWQHLPLSVANRLGPHIIPFLP